jgi:hypothetical protein
MITLLLGPGVSMSDDKSWTVTKKVIAFLWMASIDVGVIALCCM